MMTLEARMRSYLGYHTDSRNRLTHFFGIPLVTFSLLIPLGWFRFVGTDLPISAAVIFYLGLCGWFIAIHRGVGILTALWALPLLILADEVSTLPLVQSAIIFLVSFVLGMFFQLLGHKFEGRRPAFMDNFGQVFNGPLFITVEVLELVRGCFRRYQ